jgi:hypothetical protein
MSQHFALPRPRAERLCVNVRIGDGRLDQLIARAEVLVQQFQHAEARVGRAGRPIHHGHAGNCVG